MNSKFHNKTMVNREKVQMNKGGGMVKRGKGFDHMENNRQLLSFMDAG